MATVVGGETVAGFFAAAAAWEARFCTACWEMEGFLDVSADCAAELMTLVGDDEKLVESEANNVLSPPTWPWLLVSRGWEKIPPLVPPRTCESISFMRTRWYFRLVGIRGWVISG